MDSKFMADLAASPGLRYALAVGLLGALAFGVVGSYVVTRRITYIAGAIAHSVLGGVGAVLFWNARQGLEPGEGIDPLWGALVAALFCALIIGFVSLYARQREDTVIGAIWAIGMAVGVLFSFYTPRYTSALVSYLVGQVSLQAAGDVMLVLILDAIVLGTVLMFYNKFLVVCFDEEYARTRGLRAQFWYVVLLCLTALAVVIMVRLVGIILVIALLTLPAAIAGHFTRRLWQMMALASLLCMAFVASGMWAAYELGETGLPTGPVIIVIAGSAYILVALGSRLVHKFRAHS